MSPPTRPSRPSHRLSSLPAPVLQILAHPAATPCLRAYSLGFLFSTLPDAIKLALTLVLSRRRRLSARLAHCLRQLARVVAHSADPRNLAFASALALGGAKLGEPLAEGALARAQLLHARLKRGERRLALDGLATAKAGKDAAGQGDSGNALDEGKGFRAAATFLSSAVAALGAICLLQRGPAYASARVAAAAAPAGYQGAAQVTNQAGRARPVYGQSQTLDFTLFLLVRACE